jgi:hypothetical protein
MAREGVGINLGGMSESSSLRVADSDRERLTDEWAVEAHLARRRTRHLAREQRRGQRRRLP